MNPFDHLRIPTGWEPTSIHGAPLVLGPWTHTRFGADLELSSAAPPSRATDDSVTGESALRTLVRFNLDHLFPGFGLQLAEDPCCPDLGLVADDTAGCRHLFLFAPGPDVVETMLSYALGLLGRDGPAPFRDLPTEEQVRSLSVDLQGFWIERTPLPSERAEQVARRRVLAWAARPALPTRTTGLHTHLLVSDPQCLDHAQLYALARLRWLGHQVSIHQLTLSALGPQEGSLAQRRCWLPSIRTDRRSWDVRDDHAVRPGPLPSTVGELVARIHAARPELLDLFAAPVHERREAVRWEARCARCPSIRLQIGLDDEGTACVTLEAWFPSEPTPERTGRRAELRRVARRRLMASWIVDSVPPDSHTRSRALELVPEAQVWRSSGPDAHLEAWHTASFGSAGLQLELEAPRTPEFLAHALVTLHATGQVLAYALDPRP